MMPFQISFCTSCLNRFPQFKQTFKANIAAIIENPAAEWVLVDLGSSDGLHEFIMKSLPELPASFVFADGMMLDRWHASVAKNAAHRVAGGEILMNLDADNFIDDSACAIPKLFEQGAKVVHGWSGVMPDGTYGRIAIERNLFKDLGGYDESLLPMGFQDTDLLNRARALGHSVFQHRAKSRCAIPNTKEESVANCAEPGRTWRDFNEENRERSHVNVERGDLVANVRNPWRELKLRIQRGLGKK